MKRSMMRIFGFASLALALSGCGHKTLSMLAPEPKAFGAALVEVSGGKQIAAAGTPLGQPVVAQVNDDQGAAVKGAMVYFRGPAGVTFAPSNGLTDDSGQLSTNVTLGEQGGRYQLTANTQTKAHKIAELKVQETALGYQQVRGRQLDEQYCSRCHNPESSAERVSNYDNLETKPHAFTDGDTLNKMSDADLTAIINHGGPALNESALMPPYAYTLSKSDIQALVSYIRMISDPPYKAAGVVHVEK
jgi:mono/diheme cytochrome c family protein